MISSYEFIHEIAFGEYLEIGVQEGGSMFSAMLSKRTDSGTGVDTWGEMYGGTGRLTPDYVLWRLGALGRKVTLITGDSRDVLPQLYAQGKLYDTIYVDGDHSAVGCLIDLHNSLKLLKHGGIILVDDVDNPQHTYLRSVVEKFALEENLICEFHDAHHGIAVLKGRV